jgi:hypothetical protein
MTSCDKTDDLPNLNSSFPLYLDYWNPDGDSPEISFDEANTSEAIRIDFEKTFGGSVVGNSLSQVAIDNFRIIDRNNINHQIRSITAYEYRADIDDWKEDVEFIMEYETIEDMAVVLVLDRSESLGEDFSKVKEYAGDFVSRIFEETDQLQVGVVDFADEVNALPLSADQDEITDYIGRLQQGRFTTLYEAVNKGLNMLQEVDAEAKAIVIFTDGTDNNSNLEYNPDFLENKIKGEGDKPSDKIISFSIGLDGKGEVDKVVLNKLTANGGVATFPRSLTELQRVFENFSSGIANVYRLTYVRNRLAIPEDQPVKLRFEIETVRK